MEIENRLKRGTVRDDGKVFAGYFKGCKNGEYWVTPERYDAILARIAKSRRERYAADPEFRQRLLRISKKHLYKKFAENPEYKRQHLDKGLARQSRKYHEDPEFRRKRHLNEQTRRRNDPLYASARRLRDRIRGHINRIAEGKSTDTFGLMGADYLTVKAHFESLFSDGMSWSNKKDWHIDHRVPLASAATIEDQVCLCNYLNLQPLWPIDNRRKNSKLPHGLQFR